MSIKKTKKFGNFESLEAKKLFAADLGFADNMVAPSEQRAEFQVGEVMPTFFGGIEDLDIKEGETSNPNRLVPTRGAGSGLLGDDWTTPESVDSAFSLNRVESLLSP